MSVKWVARARPLALFIAVATASTACARRCDTAEPRRALAAPRTAAPTTPAAAAAGAPAGGVKVTLERVHEGGEMVSFGVPVPRGAVADVAQVRVHVGGRGVPFDVRELLADYDASGARTGVRALLVQMAATALGSGRSEAEILWNGGEGPAPGRAGREFSSEAVSAESRVVARTAERKVAADGRGGLALVEGRVVPKTLFVGREPRVIATFPAGYLAGTGILGPLVSAPAAARSGAGLAYLPRAFHAFALSAMYEEPYALNPHPESVLDPIADPSAWLYDRCATFLTAFFHFGEARMLRHAYRSCSHYARDIDTDGPRAGIFRGKPEQDPKYSHVRGLYAYYALTGDEAALRAGQAIAAMWRADPLLVGPYAEGRTRGIDKLWTERMLATALEGLVYGHRLTGNREQLSAAARLVATAHRHVTGDRAALASINPGVAMPPQNCFIHTAEQQAEGEAHEPWCSPWMSAMLVPPLLEYQSLTNDARVDEIFLRLGRFLRDTGSAYFTDKVLDDSFLAPSVCDDPTAEDRRRRLVPLYGAGIDARGKRHNAGEYTDAEHCADATLLTAASLRALARAGGAGPAVGPFASERDSFVALHHELSACAERVFVEQTRPRRDPRAWNSKELAEAARSDDFVVKEKIGFPSHVVSPARRISWWFNGSMLQFALLADAGVTVDRLRPGAVDAAGCKPRR